jgi:hypothetical protein
MNHQQLPDLAGSSASSLTTVAIGCGILALVSLAFFVITACNGDD